MTVPPVAIDLRGPQPPAVELEAPQDRAELARRHLAWRGAVVTAILTPPCILCIENYYWSIQAWGAGVITQ
jgi:hypothetical protein